MNWKWEIAKADHIGGRDEQQDKVATFSAPNGETHLLVVADGMGGHKGGNFASQIVIKCTQFMWDKSQQSKVVAPQKFLQHICSLAHHKINQFGKKYGLSPGSTCVLLYIRGKQAWWAHIGDSRLYHFRYKKLRHRTRDHSVVQLLADLGASNRIDKNGVIAFVSNNSFLEARTYDGFRKVVSEEFNAIYIVDLKGDARMSGEKRRQEGGNVFSDTIRVGVAVYFFIKDEQTQGCNIDYNAVRDYATANEKKAYLRENQLKDLHFKRVIPDKNHNWLNLTNNDFNNLLLLATQTTKLGKSQPNEQTVFKLSAYGVVTARDEWVYDNNCELLKAKIQFFIERFNLNVVKLSNNQISKDELDHSIKLSDSLKRKLFKLRKIEYQDKYIVPLSYRPFTKKIYYSEKVLSDRLTSYHYEMFGHANLNIEYTYQQKNGGI
jgi:hypothetical protein